jgi:hypothetical protein
MCRQLVRGGPASSHTASGPASGISSPIDLDAGPLSGGKLETLTTFFGGQGTINVNSWAPDSKRLAYVIYEPTTRASPRN